VNDGELDKKPWGEQIADQVIQGGYKNVGVIKFPAFAYPLQGDIDTAFRAKIDTYNSTAADADKIKLVDTIELNFTALDDTYLTENPNLDCIFSIAAGASNVYPVLVAAGRTDVKLFTTGFEGTDDCDNFRSSGNGCYQGVLFSQPEAMVYSLCQVIDKINGVSYSDAPEFAEVVSSSNVAVNSDEDMKVVKEKSMYYSADFSKSLLTGSDVAMLCKTYNPDATYAKLCETVQHMGVADLAAK
jgi:ABC-type sugar transport system substrate-binding protein